LFHPEKMNPKRLTPDQARLKIQSFCAYQERSHKEVRDKLYSFGLFKDEVDQLCTELIRDNYLNEERFAQAFASGKFRIKKWGWLKIEMQLKQKGISGHCLKQARKEIQDEEYFQVLTELAKAKGKLVKANNLFEKKAKVAAFLAGRGFEAELIWLVLKGED